MRSLKSILGHAIRAPDGTTGPVSDFLFDDRTWTVRYGVGHAGGRRSGGRFLFPPADIVRSAGNRGPIPENPAVGDGGQIPDISAHTVAPSGQADSGLISIAEAIGYGIEASDGPIGAVDDFFVDDQEWKIQYLVVDPGDGRRFARALVSTAWVRQIRSGSRTFVVDISRESLRRCISPIG